jgi:hypothetical protein
MTTIDNAIFSFFQIYKIHQNFSKAQQFEFNITMISSDFHIKRSKVIFAEL